MGREDAPDWFKPGTQLWAHGEYYGTFIITDLLHHSVGFIDWNVALDEKGGPDHGDPTGEECEGLIQCGSAAMLIADFTALPPVVYKQAFYWYMAHVSRFVPVGSVRVGSVTARAAGGASTLLAAAFATPDGGTALVAMNDQDTPEWVVVADARFGEAGLSVPAHAIVTLVY